MLYSYWYLYKYRTGATELGRQTTVPYHMLLLVGRIRFVSASGITRGVLGALPPQ